MSVDIAGRAHPGQHRGRYAEPFQDLLIPAESVNVKKHGPGSIGEPVYNAIVWQCRRTSDMIQELKKDGFDQVISRKTGLVHPVP